jgi:hypothetical protein
MLQQQASITRLGWFINARNWDFGGEDYNGSRRTAGISSCWRNSPSTLSRRRHDASARSSHRPVIPETIPRRYANLAAV